MNQLELIDGLTNVVMEIIRAEFDLYEAPEESEEPYSQDDALYSKIHEALNATYKEVMK